MISLLSFERLLGGRQVGVGKGEMLLSGVKVEWHRVVRENSLLGEPQAQHDWMNI